MVSSWYLEIELVSNEYYFQSRNHRISWLIPVRNSKNNFLIVLALVWISRVMDDQGASQAVGVLSHIMGVP
jgi:hypothetical protein